jgi:hypothetical protein
MFNWIKKLLGKDDNKVALSSNIEVVTEDEKLHSLEVEIKQKLYEKLGIECKTVFVAKNYNLISLNAHNPNNPSTFLNLGKKQINSFYSKIDEKVKVISEFFLGPINIEGRE